MHFVYIYSLQFIFIEVTESIVSLGIYIYVCSQIVPLQNVHGQNAHDRKFPNKIFKGKNIMFA